MNCFNLKKFYFKVFKAFNSDKNSRMVRAFKMMLKFFGMCVTQSGRVTRNVNYVSRYQNLKT